MAEKTASGRDMIQGEISMIDVELAERFITRAAQYTQYNINVMNEKGIIIASSNSARVGTFHDIAYSIMIGEEEIIEVYPKDNFQGGRSGINMALMHRGRKAGVVGVSGNPNQIRDTANIVKMSLEVMIEYELKKQQYYQRQNLRSRFLDGLLYDEEADQERELSVISEQLGYDPHGLRIPILVATRSEAGTDAVLEMVRSAGILNRQDIPAITRNNNLLIFKSFPKGEDTLNEYRELLEEMLDQIDLCLKQVNAEPVYYIGSFQDDYRYYRQGFQHARWLRREFSDCRDRIFYFYDCVGNYMRETVPVYELARIYSPICDTLEKSMKDSIIELVSTLDQNNYNLKESSEKLYIHKNTLVFRYNKIKNLFHVNPVQNTADREFLNWMNLYLRKNR